MSGDADDRRVLRYRPQHHRTRSHPAVVSDNDVSQDLRTGSDHHAVAERRVALALFFPGAAERHTLVQRDVIAHYARFANHYSHAVIDEQPVADLRSRMNF